MVWAEVKERVLRLGGYGLTRTIHGATGFWRAYDRTIDPDEHGELFRQGGHRDCPSCGCSDSETLGPAEPPEFRWVVPRAIQHRRWRQLTDTERDAQVDAALISIGSRAEAEAVIDLLPSFSVRRRGQAPPGYHRLRLLFGEAHDHGLPGGPGDFTPELEVLGDHALEPDTQGLLVRLSTWALDLGLRAMTHGAPFSIWNKAIVGRGRVTKAAVPTDYRGRQPEA